MRRIAGAIAQPTTRYAPTKAIAVNISTYAIAIQTGCMTMCAILMARNDTRGPGQRANFNSADEY